MFIKRLSPKYTEPVNSFGQQKVGWSASYIHGPRLLASLALFHALDLRDFSALPTV